MSGNDDELETARRFIKDTTKQQDLLIVMDRAAATGFGGVAGGVTGLSGAGVVSD